MEQLLHISTRRQTSMLDEIVQVCSAAFEAENEERCSDAVALFAAAMPKAALATLRSTSAASACAMLASMLRHQNDECRQAAILSASRELDLLHLLRSVVKGLGGNDPARRWQAATSALQAVRYAAATRVETLERLRAAGGLMLVIDAWKSGGHTADISQECCLLALLLASHHAKTTAASGAVECSLSTWNRFCQDPCRGQLLQGVAEVVLLCLPYLSEIPPVLPRLAAESLRALTTSGPEIGRASCRERV